MLVSKIIKMKWNSNNKARYTKLQYKFTKMNDYFMVKISDLSKSSHKLVVVKCDYCGKVLLRPYCDYLRCNDKNTGDACLECKKYKTEHTNMKKYGVKSTAQVDSVRQKQLQTTQERYGCKYYFQSNQFKLKSRQTCLNRYGCEYGLQFPQIKEKLFQTNLQKYGNKCSLHGEEVALKVRKTNLKRYGVPYSLQSPVIRAKGMQTLESLGKVRTSKQQLQLYNLLKELYGSCVLNYPVSSCSLDCMLNVNDCKIDIEYDGQYWHKDAQKDRRRDEFIKSCGYKVLRVKGNREIPTKEQLQKAIDYLVKGNHSYTEILLDI